MAPMRGSWELRVAKRLTLCSPMVHPGAPCKVAGKGQGSWPCPEPCKCLARPQWWDEQSGVKPSGGSRWWTAGTRLGTDCGAAQARTKAEDLVIGAVPKKMGAMKSPKWNSILFLSWVFPSGASPGSPIRLQQRWLEQGQPVPKEPGRIAGPWAALSAWEHGSSDSHILFEKIHPLPHVFCPGRNSLAMDTKVPFGWQSFCPVSVLKSWRKMSPQLRAMNPKNCCFQAPLSRAVCSWGSADIVLTQTDTELTLLHFLHSPSGNDRQAYCQFHSSGRKDADCCFRLSAKNHEKYNDLDSYPRHIA